MQEKRILFVPIAILAFLLILPVVLANEDVLFIDGARPSTEQESSVINAKLIEINWGALKNGQKKNIHLNLFDGSTISAVRDRLDVSDSDSYVWVGHIQGSPNSSVTLSTVDRTMVGSIIDGSEQYTIAHDGPGQILRQVDTRRQEEIELEDMVLLPEPTNHGLNNTTYCEDGSKIDLLVAYTRTTREKIGGTAAMKALINQRVSEMNSANRNSGLSFDFNLVHAMETYYPETGNVSVDLPRLQHPDDKILDDVAAARDHYSADLTSLIISEAQAGSGCGMAYVMNEMSTNFANYAYNIVALDYAGANLTCNSLTMAHEFGHNMGNRHDRNSNNTPPLLPFAHGYQSPKGSFRTIMAYNCPGGCPRINYWSDPDIRYSGEVLGVSHEANSSRSADNGRSMEQTALHVANFRQKCPAAPDPTPTNTPQPGIPPTATPPASTSAFGNKSYAPSIYK